ncbi:hypothetical protein B0T24DRAFT_367723 [Lasiosphaeria ovina]|uniref:AA1-like domain-containing protein n=1 Tax=Lasiosphaeria ovina TaxID=92902 RepID=A0AAE0JYL3_9PEZI|nr:hypothetical protein B0T24DRAFT_367723 [Lasiosphaeria ovina]
MVLIRICTVALAVMSGLAAAAPVEDRSVGTSEVDALDKRDHFQFFFRFYSTPGGVCDHKSDTVTTDPPMKGQPYGGTESLCFTAPGGQFGSLEINRDLAALPWAVTTFSESDCKGTKSPPQRKPYCFTSPGAGVNEQIKSFMVSPAP